MSQKGEKYARRMERRVDKLEQDVAAITTEQTTQGVRISAVEDDLAVYRAAVSARELKQAAAEIKAAKERRTARAAERERKARRRNKVLAFIALALFVAVCVVMVAKAYSEEPRLIPEDGKSSSDPKGIIPQADTPRSVIDLINGIDTVFLLQLHPQGNKISHIQVFDNLILTVLPFANSDVGGADCELPRLR